jgi:hypothetical protein
MDNEHQSLLENILPVIKTFAITKKMTTLENLTLRRNEAEPKKARCVTKHLPMKTNLISEPDETPI